MNADTQTNTAVGTQTDGKPKPNVIVVNNNEAKKSKKRKERKVPLPSIDEYQPTKAQRWRIYQKKVKPELDKIITENLKENDLTKKIKGAFEEFKIDEVNKVKDVATSGNYFGDNLFDYNQRDLTKINNNGNNQVIRNQGQGQGQQQVGEQGLLFNEFGNGGEGIARLLRQGRGRDFGEGFGGVNVGAQRQRPTLAGMEQANIIGSNKAPIFEGTRTRGAESGASTPVNTSMDFIDNLFTPVQQKKPLSNFEFTPSPSSKRMDLSRLTAEITPSRPTPSPATSRGTPSPSPISRGTPEVRIKRAIALESGITQRRIEGRVPQKISERLQNARIRQSQSAKK